MNEIDPLLTPIPDPDSGLWWAELAERRLTVPHCLDCGQHFFPPQPRCNRCGSERHELEASTATGLVYSWVVTHRAFSPTFADEVPYAVVAVDLTSGGRLTGRYLGDLALLAPDLVVRYEPYVRDGLELLGFTPA